MTHTSHQHKPPPHTLPPPHTNAHFHKSVALHVMYKRKGAEWKEVTDTVTYFIAKDSLPTYTYIATVGKLLFYH